MSEDMDSGPFVGSKRSVEGSPVPEPSSSEIVSPLKPEQDHHTKLSPGFRVDENINTGSSVGIEVGLSGIQEPKAAEDLLDMKKKQLLEQVEALVMPDPSSSSSVTCLKVEVIDETALIETVNGNKARNQTRKEKVANGIKIKKSSGVGAKISCSRKELEAVRFVSPAQQKKLWKHVYNGLGPLVAKEYDDLAVSKNHNNNSNNNIQFSNNHRKRFAAPGILGVGATRRRWNQMNVFVH